LTFGPTTDDFIYVILVFFKRSTWSNNKVRELDIRGIVHYEFAPTGQTVNQVYYLEVLKRLPEKDGNDPNFLPTIHGSCFMTMHLLTRHHL